MTNRFLIPPNRKSRVLIYSVFFLGMIVYLVLYIDSIRFFNLKKTILNSKKEVELVGFDSVMRTISPDNKTGARLEIIDNRPYLHLEGFEKNLLNSENASIFRRKSLHPTVNLALFSLGYASQYFLGHCQKGTLGENEIQNLESVYEFVSGEILNPFSLNAISVNDHVVSERIQFLILFTAFLKEHYPDKTPLLRRLSKDLNICLGFITDDRFFTWRTNHGVMQVRTLAQLSAVIENQELTSDLLALMDKRLEEITDYHIGPDGAVYEGASSYWMFIYNQLLKITEIQGVNDLRSVAMLKKKLNQTRRFIQTVTTDDGFLQGVGDSYSMYDPDISIESSINPNRYYQFSNKLIGAHWSGEDMNYGVMFVSLHSPPNVHKLPEDLALYLYINQPIFASSGIFSYINSPARMFIESEESQSTVCFLNHPYKMPESSDLSLEEFNDEDNTLIAHGIKEYGANETIARKIKIDPKVGIYIKDSTFRDRELVAYYNVKSGIEVEHLDDSSIQLKVNDDLSLNFISNGHIEVTEGMVSEKTNTTTEIKRLKITGNPIEVMIRIPECQLDQPMELIHHNEGDNSRMLIAERLEMQYESKKYTQDTRESMVNRIKVSILFFLVFVVACELYGLIRKSST